MTQYGYALLGLTAIVAMVVGILMIAALKFVAGSRSRPRARSVGDPTILLSTALQDAMTRLQAQERATSARADASEQLATQIVASLTAGLLVVDRAGRIEILNPAGRSLLEAPAEPVGTDYRVLLASAPSLRDAVAECLATGQPILRRAAEIAARDRIVHLGVTISPLVGDQPGAICLFSDLTSVIELEEQLRLKEALASVGELTAGLAHEFRNGLATIHGYSRLLTPDTLPSSQRSYVEGIRQEAETLGQIVANFLSFARPDRVSLAPVSLESIIRRVCDELRHELPPDTSIDVRGEFGEVQGDEVLLKQVFVNLVRNAIEACGAIGGQPVIEIAASVDQRRRMCRVSVRDNGPGIPEAVRSRVFQPFFTTRSRGTGLGLAIVQKVVVLHNGRVSAGTSPLGGAQIELLLPLG
jgi:signal transduction histidine kinase